MMDDSEVSVVRSSLDPRVWVPVDDYGNSESYANAGGLKKVKQWVEEHYVAVSGTMEWKKTDKDTWDYIEVPNA